MTVWFEIRLHFSTNMFNLLTSQEDNRPHLRCAPYRINNSDVKFEDKFGNSDTIPGRRPDIFVTPLNDVPPGSTNTSTAAV